MSRYLQNLVVIGVTFWTPYGTADNASFSVDQADIGAQKYAEHCAVCHGSDMRGIHLSPPLVGERFDQSWRGKPVSALAFHVQRMPVAAPNSLSAETYTNLLAFILKANGLPQGKALPNGQAELDRLHIPPLPGDTTDPYAPVAHSSTQSELLQNLSIISDATVANPSADDWIRWGNTSNGTNFSKLAQINRENIVRLQPAWRAPLRSGANMSAPLVHQGIMYLHTYPDTVLAMEASTGQVLWRYAHPGSSRSSAKMGIGLHAGKVLVPTSDLRLLALNAKDGTLIWNHAIDTRAPAATGRAQYQLRTAPLVVGDKVIQGVTASFMPKGGFIVAVDINSGEERWRFDSIARPGEPGGETWNNLPIEKRSGGSVWHQGTYDAELNLVYFGIAPTYDTGPLLHELDAANVSNAALYTNCTVAINPDTGELVWFYQHMPNDQWDLDWAFERQIVSIPIDGKPRKVVMNTGKMAVLEALDARTGEYLFSIDPGVQNVITAIDPETGAKTIDPEKMPSPDRPTTICPTALGARSWPPTSFSTQTGLAYLPLFEMCMLLSDKGSALLTSGVRISAADHPDAQDGKLARLPAVDLANKRLAWTHDQVAPISTGLLTTAGGLLFSGDVEPSLKAFNDKTGELLWQSPLSAAPTAGLMTYRVDGVQYLAVMVGVANLHVGSLSRTYSEITDKPESMPLPTRLTTRQIPTNAEIWAFSLAE
ncbi:MAG: PQQ-binding-like beta-propeller repeat protein [Pseudomonadales bacterium]|nr:PQQ-binding-like beta-propeller repeat protein [Pseudomonadales bacterium]